MTEIAMSATEATTHPEIAERAASLLGGRKVLRRSVRSALQAHDLLVEGLPGEAVTHLFGNLTVLKMTGSLERAVGMSLRTFQRRKGVAVKPLNHEQSGRAWKFAEILATASEAFGSQEEAEQWLERPAIGLDGRRPIDLLATPAGVELVEDFLRRIEYGVYV